MIPLPLQFLVVMLAGWVNRQQQEVIAYLHAENHVLREQLSGKTLRFTDAQRSRLARVAHPIGRRRLREIGTIVTPDTLLRWYRKLVAKKYDGSKKRGPGRPRIAGEIQGLILEMARDNPRWGYTRIRGALENLGYNVGRNTIKRILLENGFDPADFRGTTWSTFLRAHWGAIAATDLFTIEVADPLFTKEFRRALEGSGVRSVKLPSRSPNLNAHAERFDRGVFWFWPSVLCLLAMVSRPAWSDATDRARSAQPAPTSEGSAAQIEEIVVRGRADSLIGIAESASQGTVGAEQIELRTLSRPGEVLEAVPGVIVTQHSGAGKANQFFLRGFNLDHGTDFATSIDGVPINLPTHGHGQGYTDLNFVIPELIERVNYRKGVYYADQGDFSSAGAAEFEYFRSLPETLIAVTGGRFDYGRGLLASSFELARGDLLYGLELFYNDGPWDHPDSFKKINGVLRYSQGDAGSGWSLTASAYAGDWDATDQIARRALDQPGFDRFDSLNRTDGGDSQKYMLYGEWHRSSEASASRVLVYGFYQDLDLFSDFTYYLTSPDGDQFEQTDRRWVGGAKAHHTWFGDLWDRPVETTIGLQVRSDSIRNGLFQTVARHRTDKLDYAGMVIPATTRRDDVWETSVEPYLENRTQWFEKVRSVVGVRLDYFHFDVDSDLPGGSGIDDDVIVSPKGSLIFGPWAQTELYLSGGLGFHSNDARGVTAPVDPADPLVRSYGAEVGVRTSYVRGLQSTLAFWWLELDSELLFVGDAGTTEPTRPSRRYGVELANFYNVNEWLSVDLDVSLSHARFRGNDPAGNYIPGSIESVVATGVTVHDLGGFFGELRLRYLGPRPLTEDDSVRSSDTILLSTRVGYKFGETWTLGAEVFNLLNRKDSEIDYYYASRLAGEPAGPDDGGYNDVAFHPVYPISFRVTLTARF